MSVSRKIIHASQMGDAFAYDSDLFLPHKPRLIPELLSITLPADGLLFSGGERIEVLRGRSVTTILPLVLPLLDGSNTIDTLFKRLPGISPKNIHNVVSLLFSRGLIEDARDMLQTDSLKDSQTDRYLGRFIDVTRCNGNREEARTRLSRETLAICGNSALVEDLVYQLQTSGLHVVHLTGNSLTQEGKFSLSVVVSDGTEGDTLPLAKTMAGKSPRTLLIRLGRNEVQISPLIGSPSTCCLECFFSNFLQPEGSADRWYGTYLMGIAAQQIVNSLAQISPNRSQREFKRFRIDHHREISQDFLVAVRSPGCIGCGLQTAALLPQHELRLAWLYHSATSLPSQALLSPKDHQSHYKAENLELAQEKKHSFGNVQRLELPTPLALATDWFEDFSKEPAATEAALTMRQLSTLLWSGAGERDEHGKMRRVAPTGGNLGSVDLWVICVGMEGLSSAIYRYHASTNGLELVHVLASTEIEDTSRGCLIIGTGNVSKCATKYADFAFRLCQYDAGVSIANIYAAARSLEIPLTEFTALDDSEIRSLLQIPNRREFPIPTFILSIGEESRMKWRTLLPNAYQKEPTELTDVQGCADAPDALTYSSNDLLWRMVVASGRQKSEVDGRGSHPHLSIDVHTQTSRVGLYEALVRRKATRRFAQRGIGRESLLSIAKTAKYAYLTRVACGAPPSNIRLLLGVAKADLSLQAGLYELIDGQLLRLSPFDGVAMSKCFNQRSFADAAAALFTVVNLEDALRSQGIRGYAEACQHSGNMVGTSWLAATALGLVGSAAGGVIADGLREVAGLDGFSECPLLGFPMGYPSEMPPAGSDTRRSL